MSVTIQQPSSKLFDLCGHGKPQFCKLDVHDHCNHEEDNVICGTLGLKGCLNHKGKAFIKAYKSNCMKLSCKVCLDRVCIAKAMKATKRIKAFKMPDNRFNKVRHVTISPPPELNFDRDYKTIKEYAIKSLKKVHAGTSKSMGGVLIVHPFRTDECGLYKRIGLHFHFIGYVNVDKAKVGRLFNEGKIPLIKDLDERFSTFKTIKYALNHCGVAKEDAVKKFKTLTWLGCLSYNKKIQCRDCKIWKDGKKINPPIDDCVCNPNDSLCPDEDCQMPLRKLNYYGKMSLNRVSDKGEWIKDEKLIQHLFQNYPSDSC